MEKEKKKVLKKNDKKDNTKYFIWLLCSFIDTIVISAILYFVIADQQMLEILITINKNSQTLQFIGGVAAVMFVILGFMNLGLVMFMNDIEKIN